MDLKSLIRPQLWNEISNSYIAENYKTSILDAMRYLSKVIREKSGLDGDGAQLIGQAFGGDEPKLRLNKLQTQSEKDEQRGFQQIITGLYSGIRNPRTHEDIEDDKNVADPIIYFINYTVSVIDIAKPPFTIEGFLPRIFDVDFVANVIYTSEIVSEIPKNKYLETLIEIYRNKSKGDNDKLEYVFREILGNLTDSEIKEFIAVVSAELDIVNKNPTIITVLKILPNTYWPMIKLTARMRIENKLITSIQNGKSNLYAQSLEDGALGTWTTSILEQLTLKEELTEAITDGVMYVDEKRNRYTLQYFMNYLPSIITDPMKYRYCAWAMKRLIKAGDLSIKQKLLDFALTCPDDWLNVIRDEFKDWTNPDHPEYYLRDGSQFLGNIPEPHPEEEPDDDVPF